MRVNVNAEVKADEAWSREAQRSEAESRAIALAVTSTRKRELVRGFK
jgi:hypothetical protein